MTIDRLIEDLKSYGSEGKQPQEDLADCLEDLWHKLNVMGDGARDWNKQQKLKKYLLLLGREV
jgi:hypothetical protein